MPFDSIFKIYKDKLEVKPESIRIYDMTFYRGGKIGKGIVMSGVDLYDYLGHDLEVQQDDNDLVVTGIFWKSFVARGFKSSHGV